MKKITFTLISLLTATLLMGCVTHHLKNAIEQYDAVENQIKIGDPKKEVLAILLPTQQSVPRKFQKKPDKYLKDGVNVEIYYMLTLIQRDGLTTDDEFTPYLFNNDVLVGIGWDVLGGPKTHGQTRNVTNIKTVIPKPVRPVPIPPIIVCC